MADLVRGGVDREQVRRDMEEALKPRGSWVGDSGIQFARHCLALLAELEQAERELTLALNDLTTLRTVVADLEARLAKVPALVEAATERALARVARFDNQVQGIVDEEVAAALAEWERG